MKKKVKYLTVPQVKISIHENTTSKIKIHTTEQKKIFATYVKTTGY